MSATFRRWPALDLRDWPAPALLQVERAVRGKVHGAESDFRWIASSPGLDPQSLRLERELFLGSEDAPAKATCWRALESGYCAVSCYPSRAVDAARRSGFLEKQVLSWSPGEEVPAALGALLLLPQVATFDDGVWWDRSDDPGWCRSGFLLTLAAEPSISVGNPDAIIERGRAALRETVEEAPLARLYSSLLAGRRRPVLLPGLEQPLPPEALAVLLLPLPRKIADHLSIAGWDVSQRIEPEGFPWDVLVCHQIPAGFRSQPEPEITEAGRRAARDLLEREDFGGPGPEPGPGFELGPEPAPSVAPAPEPGPDPGPGAKTIYERSKKAGAAGTPGMIRGVMERLRAFAAADGERWLEPEELAGTAPLRLMEDQAGTLAGLVSQVDAEISRLSGSSWKCEHLEVKADLLRAAALALAPAAAERVRLPKSRRIPAFLFCPRLAEEDWDRLGDRLGEARLEDAIRQSLACQPDFFGEAIRSWLDRWCRGSRLSWLRRLATRGGLAAV